MSELLKQINSLAVFGGIRQREPLNSLCAFLRLSDTVGAAQTDVIEAYSEFIRTLYTMRSDADFSGALWDSLEETENVYLDLKKNGAEKIPQLLELAVRRELDLLTQIGNTSCIDLEPMLYYDGYGPQFRSSGIDMKGRYMKMIEAIAGSREGNDQ